MRSVVLALALYLPAVPSSAQEGNALEMAGHRALARARAEGPLEPFATDGCSGGMSAAWSGIAGRLPGFAELHGDLPPWQDCCVKHDFLYHTGGSDPDPEASFEARLSADLFLRSCVIGTGTARTAELAVAYGVSETDVRRSYTAIAEAMYRAVRAGGAPCSGLPWRWGFGWPGCLPGPQDMGGTD